MAAMPRPQPGMADALSWRKGQTRVEVEVMCCPACGGLDVRIRTPRGQAAVLMQCRVCGHAWQDRRANHLR